MVLIVSSRTGERYRVTRSACDCPAGQSHGYCKHRAAAIACADLYKIDLSQNEILGFDQAGFPVIADPLREVA
jgi:uncharacterized Zn finger protein